MMKNFARLIFGLALTCSFALSADAATPFYEGKTIKLIVGFSAGGGFDTYSRLIARHLGRHIAGNPAIVVENMTGAASLLVHLPGQGGPTNRGRTSFRLGLLARAVRIQLERGQRSAMGCFTAGRPAQYSDAQRGHEHG